VNSRGENDWGNPPPGWGPVFRYDRATRTLTGENPDPTLKPLSGSALWVENNTLWLATEKGAVPPRPFHGGMDPA
jgi:hypothetical protein